MKASVRAWSWFCWAGCCAMIACAPQQQGTFGQPDSGPALDAPESGFPTPTVQPLAIEFVSPMVTSAAGGELLNIIGQGFATNAVVTVGDVVATQVTVLTSALVQVRAPANRGAAGPALLRIENPDGTQAQSRSLLSYSGGLSSPATPQLFPLADLPIAMAGADVNRDGMADLLVLTRRGIDVLLSRGAQLFAVTTSYPHNVSTVTASDLLLGDFNQDGHLDIAFAGQSVFVRYGNGSGAFSPPVAYETLDQSSYMSITAQDWNLDGKVDITGLGQRGELRSLLGPLGSRSGRCEMLLRHGGGWIKARDDMPGVGRRLFVIQAATRTPTWLSSLGAGCFELSRVNNDPLISSLAEPAGLLGQPNNVFNEPWLIMNPPNGLYRITGSFNSLNYLFTNSGPMIGLIDIFHAGYPPFATVANQNLATAYVLNTSGPIGGLGIVGSSIPLPGRPLALASGDFNLDGKRDLAVGLGPPAAVSVLLGNGLGGFAWSN